MPALGATAVLSAFSQIIPVVQRGMVDCVITGTLSGNEIGLSQVTSYIDPMAISWGLSIFGANLASWQAIPPDLQSEIEDGLHRLEAKIWTAADRDTTEGLACDTGNVGCGARHHPSHMTLVAMNPQDEARRRDLVKRVVLPAWLERCGAECLHAWNQTVGPALNITLPDN